MLLSAGPGARLSRVDPRGVMIHVGGVKVEQVRGILNTKAEFGDLEGGARLGKVEMSSRK